MKKVPWQAFGLMVTILCTTAVLYARLCVVETKVEYLSAQVAAVRAQLGSAHAAEGEKTVWLTSLTR